jgi:hypothetical protein
MSYGIKSYSDDGYLNLHSDYSSLVYVGEMSVSVAPVRFQYSGDNSYSISLETSKSKYDQGYSVQFSYNLDTDYVLPFYSPSFTNQEIAIIDLIKEGTTWKVNILFNGSITHIPQVFIFAPVSELSYITPSNNGLTVWDADSNIIFTDALKPLRIDEVIQITHPSSIRTGDRGTCSQNNSSGYTCDVHFNSDQETTFTGNTVNSLSKIYHIIPSAYGGLAYTNDGSYETSCGLLGFGDKSHAWSYKSWASFRGAIRHNFNESTHTATWEADFIGKMYQHVSGGCDYGVLGIILGVGLAVFTGGASLTMVAIGAIGGFALGSALSGSMPGLSAYEEDAMHDANNPVNLLVTDATYYGITTNTEESSGGAISAIGPLLEMSDSTTMYTGWGIANLFIPPDMQQLAQFGQIYWEGVLIETSINTTITSITIGDSTYTRGELVTTYVECDLDTPCPSGLMLVGIYAYNITRIGP